MHTVHCRLTYLSTIFSGLYMFIGKIQTCKPSKFIGGKLFPKLGLLGNTPAGCMPGGRLNIMFNAGGNIGGGPG